MKTDVSARRVRPDAGERGKVVLPPGYTASVDEFRAQQLQEPGTPPEAQRPDHSQNLGFRCARQIDRPSERPLEEMENRNDLISARSLQKDLGDKRVETIPFGPPGIVREVPSAPDGQDAASALE
jgi:hypothetical protein